MAAGGLLRLLRETTMQYSFALHASMQFVLLLGFRSRTLKIDWIFPYLLEKFRGSHFVKLNFVCALCIRELPVIFGTSEIWN